MIPRLSPSFGAVDLVRAIRMLMSDSDPRERFAREWSRRTGIPRVALFPHGRSAIRAFLQLIPAGSERTEVVIPAYTCVAVAEAVVIAGFTPVFVDIEHGMLEPTPRAMAGATGPRTRAVVATHLFGRRYPVAELRSLVDPAIALLEDRAHCSSTALGGRTFALEGDAAFWSFNHGKPLSAVFGSAIALPDGELADRAESAAARLRERTFAEELGKLQYAAASCVAFRPAVFGLTRALTDPSGPLESLTAVFQPDRVTFPGDADVRLSRIAAALALVQREDPDHRHRLHQLYSSQLQRALGFSFPSLPPDSTPSHFITLADERDRLRLCLRARGIDAGMLFSYAVPDLPSMAPWRRGPTPHATRVAGTILNLPLHCGVDEAVVARVAKAIRECRSAAGAAESA